MLFAENKRFLIPDWIIVCLRLSLVWFRSNQFTHIFQDISAGTGVIKWLTQFQWCNTKEHLKRVMNPLRTGILPKTKQNEILCMFYKM